MALVDGEGWVAGVIGAVFLLGTALHVGMVVRALRARRHPAPPQDDADERSSADDTSSADGTAPAAPVRRPRWCGAPPRRSPTPGARRPWPSASSR
ncbi:hypothetical protein ACFQV4_22970 [Streptomyces thermocarboxydus]